MSREFRVVSTAAGFVAFAAGDLGLRRVWLPESSESTLRRRVAADMADARENPRLLPGLAAALRDYFEGRPVRFDTPFDWSGRSEFDIAVWKACAEIGYGRTQSYQDLASRVGRPRGARAVGAAMGRNPIPVVVPCHRVLRSDGELGGYSGPGGIAFKRRLLDMESAAAR